MQTFPSSNGSLAQSIAVSRCDRWCICHRLQECMIACSCPTDGSLQVEVQYGIELILVRSIVQQFTAPHHELVNWLERCWASPEICKENR
ncbi:Asr1405/Asl0597 family protein [Leptolyngbya sp. AN02str]|uniref:Asr1405/Asl0597 family protein n=1 Tax=Leptolyngbya sp. AN02str TaxID=3423363 RepID=UPI003D31ED59